MRISLDNQFGPASPLILCWNTRWGISFKSLVLVRVFLISMKEDPPLLQNTTCINVAFNLSTTGLISGFIFFRNLHSYFNLKCRENILSSKIKVQRNSHNLLIFSTNKKKKKSVALNLSVFSWQDIISVTQNSKYFWALPIIFIVETFSRLCNSPAAIEFTCFQTASNFTFPLAWSEISQYV